MKNIKYTVFLSTLMFLTIFLVGCEDFLQEDPKNFINPESFYQNQADAESGLTGIYAAVTPYYNIQMLNFLDQQMSEFHWPFSFTSADVGYINYSPEYPAGNKQWATSYEGIKRANSYIEVLSGQEIDFAPELRDRYLAEARFLRAFFYYNLVNLYGDVPLVTKSFKSTDNLFVERNPESVIYDFIVTEMLDIAADLPHKSEYKGSDISRANKEASKTLLAKVFMIQGNWEGAKQAVDEIIKSSEYSLEEDIKDNWIVANEHGKESIYEVDYGSGFIPKLGNSLVQITGPGNLIHPVTGQVIGGLYRGLGFTPWFYDSFDAQDQRKLELFYEVGTYSGPDGEYWTSKFFDPTEVVTAPKSNDQNVNMVVFRYADILLMKAEIENELNHGPNSLAYDAINMVRRRAGIDDLQNMDYDEFLGAVYDERAKELFTEGHRFMDLKRRGFNFLKGIVEPSRQRLYDFVGIDFTYTIEEYMLKLPIPQSEIDVNPNLVQNPGY